MWVELLRAIILGVAIVMIVMALAGFFFAWQEKRERAHLPKKDKEE